MREHTMHFSIHIYILCNSNQTKADVNIFANTCHLGCTPVKYRLTYFKYYISDRVHACSNRVWTWTRTCRGSTILSSVFLIPLWPCYLFFLKDYWNQHSRLIFGCYENANWNNHIFLTKSKIHKHIYWYLPKSVQSVCPATPGMQQPSLKLVRKNW